MVAFTGWYQVKQTQARQLQTSNTPVNAQMQAMTKIFPVFFAFICFTLNAGATVYFVVSNIWRIGQQHLVIGKLYDQAIAAGDLKPKAGGPPPPAKSRPPRSRRANGKGQPAGAKGSRDRRRARDEERTERRATGPKGSNGTPNGSGGSPGMSSGQRRKKRKR